jgi:uncharacterized protein YlxP (DUF503 family)|uniref:DUF503 domain-containing protein n=1 Tax=candidate division WOR-3 bacterium TaxID=2052148 RepID=A0A7C4U9Y7_UNCW3
MIFGLGTIDIHIPLSSSLKEKRRVLNPLKSRIRNKFNVAISEVGYNDVWQRSLLAITTVGNNTDIVNSVLMEVVKEIEKDYNVQIIDYKMEIKK